MTSSCLSGGGRPYGFDLDIVKSPATSSARASSPASSSLTSTLSESTNSPLSLCNRKARNPRKRPNQTYHEAAALLSAAYPNIFSPMQLINPRKPPPPQTSSPDDPSALFLPFPALEDESVFLIHHPSRVQKLPSFHREPGLSPSCCQTLEENEIQSKAAHIYDEYGEDFDAESILDEEIEEGIIDSIMGEKKSSDDGIEETSDGESKVVKLGPYWGRNPMALLGLGRRLDICYGIGRAGVSAWKDVGHVDWWKFPTVDVTEISPKFKTNPASYNNNSAGEKKKKKKKKKKKRKGADIARNMSRAKGDLDLDYSRVTMGLRVNKSGLMLKLDYDNVLEAWTGRGSPFPDDSPVAGNDVAVSK